ncbi:MAG TPA: DNA gyrase C-terminal beta-propeller domain-containing protein, partial [Acidobacteriota bacterium]|nr:DNA gyrase C-terminal beta-propeller domain-containing protein [Acidobacteriota bacterium]
LIFTDRGRVHWLKVYEIPDVGAAGKGKPIVTLLDISKDERIADIIAVPDFDISASVAMVSRQGYIKKTHLSAFSNPRAGGIIAGHVEDDDQLLRAELCYGDDHILLCSRKGKAIRFSEQDVREMGRTARGVRGMSLKEGDEIVSMAIIRDESGDILSVTENGYGKRTPVSEYRRQGRAGQGVINIKINHRNGDVVGAVHVQPESEIILITSKGKIIRLQAENIRQTASRATLGVKLIDLEPDDRVADLSLVPPEEPDEILEEDSNSAHEGDGDPS